MCLDQNVASRRIEVNIISLANIEFSNGKLNIFVLGSTFSKMPLIKFNLLLLCGKREPTSIDSECTFFELATAICGVVYTKYIVCRILPTVGIAEPGGFIGYDFFLSGKLSDHLKESEYRVYVSFLSTENPLKHLNYLLKLHKRGVSPSTILNWNDDEPINLGPVGAWIGWGSGSTSVITSETQGLKFHLDTTKYNNLFQPSVATNYSL